MLLRIPGWCTDWSPDSGLAVALPPFWLSHAQLWLPAPAEVGGGHILGKTRENDSKYCRQEFEEGKHEQG